VWDLKHADELVDLTDQTHVSVSFSNKVNQKALVDLRTRTKAMLGVRTGHVSIRRQVFALLLRFALYR
jgi:hypothetical protein